jgi:glyoxylase-like metal-dependent hydrolase (beta-lactamase superfamily II)
VVHLDLGSRGAAFGRPDALEEFVKRSVVLGTILALGVLSYAVAAQAPQGPSPASIAATKIEKVKDGLYVITGSGAGDMASFSGGNTAVFITDAGVTLVDTKLPGFGPTLLERIRTVTDKTVTRIINTHAHGDHTGGNAYFKPPVEIIVHEGAFPNMDKARQTRTYKDRLTVGSGRDRIDLYHFGRGHTNGDTFVVFPALRTMHTGDMFAWKGLPYVDPGAGGSVVEQRQSLANAVAAVKDVDTIINGHIPTATWAEFVQYADFVRDFVDYAEASRKAGKSVDQAAAEYRVPARFKGYTPSIMANVTPASNLKLAYDELSRR